MQELEKILEEIAVDEGYLTDWYINSTDDSKPVWTDEHIEELAEDFILIPKSEIREHMNNGWIPVEEELPPNAKHMGTLCPRYQLSTKYGVTEGWYNPDLESWFVLLWFLTEGYENKDIDFDKGTCPQIVRCENKVNGKHGIILAWRPLPEPYRKKDR